jgi:hypothetical protein
VVLRRWVVATGQEDTGRERMGLRVLVVDDSATVRANAEKILKRAGCEVRTTVSRRSRPWPNTDPISSSLTS